MKKITIFLLILFALKLSAQVPNWNWAKESNGDKQNLVTSIAVDKSGNSYTVGYFYSTTIQFGSFTLTNTSPYNCDVYILKCNRNGDVMWAKNARGISSETTFSVTVDDAGNAYWLGGFSSPQLEFGTTILNNASYGTSDIFLVKYSPEGNVLWAKQYGGAGNDFAATVKMFNNSDIYLTGNFASMSMTVGTNTLINSGSDDLFLAKLDLDGNVLWAKSGMGSGSEIASDLAIDRNGNCIFGGSFASKSFNIGGKTLNADTTLVSTFFIAKFDKSGNAVWAKSASNERAQHLALDSIGNIFVTGAITGVSSKFDTFTLVNADKTWYDMYIVKFSSTGNLLWAQRAGGDKNDDVNSIIVDYDNNAILAGSFNSSSLSFGQNALNSNGDYDIFLARYTSDGIADAALKYGGTKDEEALALGLSKDGDLFMGGVFNSPMLNFGNSAVKCPTDNGVFLTSTIQPSNNIVITGCMDPKAKNYNALATQPAQCVYDSVSTNQPLTYNVTVPAGTIQCYFAGEINGWVQQLMNKIDDTHYTITFQGATANQQYKYCSGPGWGFVENTPNGNNRTWTAADVVTSWAQIYNPQSTPQNVTYSVKVPVGTKTCYIAGAHSNWQFNQMQMVDSTHYTYTTLTISPNKYKYASGPEWKYAELDSLYNAVNDRDYNPNDVVLHWGEIYNPNGNTTPIYGCKDPMAKNYNPLATMPAQCIYDSTTMPIYGCKDPVAKNYNPLATMPAQCIYDSTTTNPIMGCMDQKARNYNPLATQPGPCVYDSISNQIVGCMDSKARNYNPLATVPAPCVYDSTATPIYGCKDPSAKNYNSLATLPGPCVYDSTTTTPIYGCKDPMAKNYNPLATMPAQCIYDSTTTTPVYGCMDVKAKNYNPLATMPAQCIYDSTATTPLTYKVTVPAGTVECYFAGMINNWTQQKMTKTGNLQYEITFPNATKWQEYKYCSGPSWAFGENTPDGKNRVWSENDVVTSWANLYNPNATATDVTYTVTVPLGTNTCYFAGAANNWQFSQMIRVTATTYKITLHTAYRDKYKYLSGPDWKYCELDSNYQSTTDRNFTTADMVMRWGLVYNPNGADEIIGCTNPKATNFNKLATKDDGSCQFPQTTVPVYGCTNPVARNYNPLATIENGSCLYGDSTLIVWGCTNSTASNYNPKAVKDNGTCVFGTANYVFGCMNPTAKNYNPQATKEDGSCIFVDSALVVWGCTNPTAKNYNPKANRENGTCTFVDSVQVVWGCTNVLAKNYNPKATMENGSCIFAADPTVIFGCTKQGALNYNPLANKENGSCVFKDTIIAVLGCTSPMAKNYNPTATKDNGTCIFQDSTKMILGCTNPTAKNYNRLATHDNGTCVFSDEATKIYGCTKSTAKNYNPLATVENGSCIFNDTIKLPVYGCTNKLALNYNPLATVNNGTCKFEEQLVKGCMDKKAKNYNPLARVNDGSCIYDSIRVVYGCTDSLALNYNPLAKIDNNNCIYQTLIPGCMDVLALNYNPYANVKDGSCKYPVKIWGCTDKSAVNYNSLATHNDGNCQYVTQILGCTDPLATNYNPLATKDNRTCVFPPVVSLGCTNKQALNYNPNANTDNGTCVFETITDTISGCMDKAALNYNPVATKSNGSCVYAGVSIAGCTSQMALNYNPKATEDDESCIFAKPINIVIPVDNDKLVAVKDTLAKVLENSCSFDFATPIDTVYIVSSSMLSVTEVQVVWAIKQGAKITNLTSNYIVDNDGKALLFLSLVCNGGATKVIATGKYGAPYGGSSVQGVTISSYYQVPSVSTRLITLSQTNTDLNLYPNPVKELLQVDYKSNKTEIITVDVRSLDGKRLISNNVNAQIGRNTFTINTSALTPGIYMISVRSNTALIHVDKLIKTN